MSNKNLTTQQVYPEIANDVIKRNLEVGQYIKDGFVKVGGVDIIYRAKKLTENWINIGTFVFKG